MDRTFLLLACLVMCGVMSLAASAPAPGHPSLQQLALETRPDGVTVVVRTGAPVPRYTLAMASGLDGELTVHFPGVVNAAPRDASATSPFLEGMTIVADDGPAAGVVVKVRPRGAAFTGLEQREDSVAIRFVARGLGADPEGAEYRVGVGDKIEISVFGHDDMTRTAEVRADGTINFPMVGDFKVAGKTVTQIDADMTQALGREYLVDPEVSVDVKEFKSQWVTLMGEARTPGRYVLRPNMHLIDLLAEAGGPSKEAGNQIVLVRHQADGSDSRQITLRIDDILNPAKPESSLTLRHGDIVTISAKEMFYIRGEVARPGPYYVGDGPTILRAIGVAGGLTAFANRKEVQLLRSGNGGIQEKTVVNLKSVEDGRKEDVGILANDVIIVPRRIF